MWGRLHPALGSMLDESGPKPALRLLPAARATTSRPCGPRSANSTRCSSGLCSLRFRSPAMDQVWLVVANAVTRRSQDFFATAPQRSAAPRSSRSVASTRQPHRERWRSVSTAWQSSAPSGRRPIRSPHSVSCTVNPKGADSAPCENRAEPKSRSDRSSMPTRMEARFYRRPQRPAMPEVFPAGNLTR